MQDRFKFRVVYYNDVEKKYFIFEPDLISADGTARAYAYGESGADEYYDTVTLNQCTGLKDKNGRLIYEGDILKGKENVICSPHSLRMIDKVGVVEIPQNMFVATCRDVKNNRTLFCQNDWVKTEVIGNIYQDKELLNEI